MKNKYMFRSRISEKKFREILKFFLLRYTRNFARSLDLEAKKIAEICKISRVCVNRILREIRILIAKECEKISKMSGEIEVDESYFLLRYTRNCNQKVLAECVASVGVGLKKRHLCSVC